MFRWSTRGGLVAKVRNGVSQTGARHRFFDSARSDVLLLRARVGFDGQWLRVCLAVDRQLDAVAAGRGWRRTAATAASPTAAAATSTRRRRRPEIPHETV